MPMYSRFRFGVGEHVEGAPDDVQFRDALPNTKFSGLHLCPIIKRSSRRETYLLPAFIRNKFAYHYTKPIPLFNEAVLVFLDLTRDKKALACPARTLLEGPVIIDNGVADTLVRETKSAKLFYEVSRICINIYAVGMAFTKIYW